MVITSEQSIIANLARDQLNRENKNFPVPVGEVDWRIRSAVGTGKAEVFHHTLAFDTDGTLIKTNSTQTSGF